MQNLLDVYNTLFIDWEYGKYLQAVSIFFIFYLALILVRILVEKSLKNAVKKTKLDFDDLIVNLLDSFGMSFYFIMSLSMAVQVLDVSSSADLWIKRIVFVAISFYVVKAVNTIMRYGFKKYSSCATRDSQDPTALKVLDTFLEILIWILALLIVLQNFGYNISTLLGGLGIVGIAVAFGLQNVLEDIFSFFTLYFDKPFKIGDFVVVGKDSGTVKKIGIKSTRIKTLQGQQLVISNKELTGTRVNNYKKMKTRRVEFEFGVTYSTSSAKLEKIPAIVEGIIKKIDLVEHKRTNFKELGEFALVFQVVYLIEDASYEKFVDIRQEINLDLVKKFEKEKIEFAYPTSTVYVRN